VRHVERLIGTLRSEWSNASGASACSRERALSQGQIQRRTSVTWSAKVVASYATKIDFRSMTRAWA
jgi:hypothetical protein